MISIVLPVYNSAAVVAATLDRIVATCAAQPWAYEVIAVDDASRDASACVLAACASRHASLRVVTLDANVGQHAALLIGLRAAGGDIVVCMDDDLQHPPEAIPQLVLKVREGHDAVFARFAQQRHARWRRVGSAVMRVVDRRVFGAPRHLAVSSFRAMTRDVVQRVCAYRGASPWIRGQILLASRTPASVDVEHRPRGAGHSSYSAMALAGVVARVLIEWSRVPVWCALALGTALIVSGAVLYGGATGPLRACGVLLLLHGGALLGTGLVLLARVTEKRRPSLIHPRGKHPEPFGGRVEEFQATVGGRPVLDQAATPRVELRVQRPDAARREEGPRRC